MAQRRVARRLSGAAAAEGVVTLPVVSAQEHAPDGGSEPDPAASKVPGPPAGGVAGARQGQAADEAAGAARPSGGESSSDPANEGVIDLLGLLAYASLVAFFRLADDASLAASLPDKADLAAMAVTQFGHYAMLRDRIVELGADPELTMQPFVDPIDSFHARTAPADWLESLVKAYVGDGIAADFYRVVAQLLD